jgi:hypothetical protein
VIDHLTHPIFFSRAAHTSADAEVQENSFPELWALAARWEPNEMALYPALAGTLVGLLTTLQVARMGTRSVVLKRSLLTA